MNIFSRNINNQIETYLRADYLASKGYERFRFLKDNIINNIKPGDTFLDIGCAKGEFFYYLLEYLKDIKFTGIEYNETLVSLGQKEPSLKDVEFIIADAQTFQLKNKFDHVLMNGVLSIFDDIEKILGNMINHIKSNGYGYIFGLANKYDMDVILRFKNNAIGNTEWESGLNNFSLNTIKGYLEASTKNLSITEFKIPLNLQHQNDPIKSYTLETEEEGKIILNGSGLRTDFYLISFQKK